MSGFIEAAVTPGPSKHTEIQNAIDTCPLGATLVFTPGTYGIDRMIQIGRRINIWAYGTTFDLGTNAPAQTLTNETFASAASWIALDGWSIGGGVATWDASGGTNGLLTQLTSAFRFAVQPGRKYGLRYRVVSNNSPGVVFKVTTNFATTNVTLNTLPGSYYVILTANNSPGGFELSVAGTTGTLAIDDLYLVPLFAEIIPATFPNPAVVPREDFTVQAGTDQSAIVWGNSCQTGDETRPEGNFIYGLRVIRTTAAPTAAERKYAGIVMAGVFECRLMDARIESFREGLVLTTLPAADCGTVHNEVMRSRIINCRYGLTLYVGSLGWVNGNKFDNNRINVSTDILAHSSYNPEEWELRRILWHSQLTGRVPNGNFFTETTVEAPENAGTPYAIGRKLRLEGQDNVFLNDRWENPRPVTPTVDAGTFDTPNKWQTAGAWTISGGQAVCTGAGTLTQVSGNFLYPFKAKSEYVIQYTVASSSLVGASFTCDFGAATVVLPTQAGTHRIPFRTGNAASSNFVLSVAGAAAGQMALDEVSLIYQQPDITVGESSRTDSFFTRNRFLHGIDLDSILQGNKIEFLSSTTTPKNFGNIFEHSNSMKASRIDAPDVISTAHRFASNVDAGVLGILSTAGRERLRINAGKTSPATWGHLEFLNDTVPPSVRWSIGLDAAEYLKIVQHDDAGLEAGDLFIAPGPASTAFSGRLGFPHGTTPAKPADFPAAEIDLYDGRIAQMGWHRLAAAGTGEHTTSKEVIVGVTQVPKIVNLALSDRVVGRIIVVKDETGSAGTQGQEIRIFAQSALIDGNSEYDITTDYGFVKLYCNGTNWFVIGRSYVAT